jgi:tetratricopeptide (TPR) repeat protein
MVNRRRYSLFLIIFLCGLTLRSTALAESRAESLFQNAMIKENGERDPEAALALYQQAIDQAGSDHRLVAKARLHMGNCLERLGKSKEAEEIYLQIINESTANLVEAVQAAQANLERLQTEEKKARDLAAKSKPMVLVQEFHDTRISLLGGLAGLESGGHLQSNLSLGARYRISPLSRPLGLYGEIGGFIPFGNSTINSEINGSLKLDGQMQLALMGELPHGTQNRTIPEIGIGAALTSSEINSGPISEGHSLWSPYFEFGVRLRADRRVSVLLIGSYTANPYPKTIQPQTFDSPNSLWNLVAMVQIKLGRTKTVMRPKE